MGNRRLGNSGLLVSPQSIGCWSFGGGEYWGDQAQEDVNQVVDAALDYGINLFDTAESYNDGASEQALGAALRGKRDRAIVITKQFVHPGQDDTIERCEAALRRLETDYIDVLMVHWPSNDEKVMEPIYRRFEQLQKSGKVRALGVSNFGVQQLEMMQRLGFSPCVNELHYNIASRAIDAEIKPLCEKLGISVITYVSLQQGVLTGKYRTLDQVPPKQARYRHFHPERCQGLNNHKGEGAEEELVTLLSGMQKICESRGCTMIELSLGWALRQSGIASTIVGCRNLDQFWMNVKGAEYFVDDQTNAVLLQLSEPLRQRLGNCPDYLKPLSESRVR